MQPTITSLAVRSVRATTPYVKQAVAIAGSTIIVFSTMELMRYGKEKLSLWLEARKLSGRGEEI